MYRYMPPKASIWGHTLRKIKPAQERELFSQFLESAVAQYRIDGGSLFVLKGPRGSPEVATATRQRFADVLNAPKLDFVFDWISAAQIDACFNELLLNERLYAGQQLHVTLIERFYITRWLIDNRESRTESSIQLHYGSSPRISTCLWFDNQEEFHHVREILARTLHCRLNEKYLKFFEGH